MCLSKHHRTICCALAGVVFALLVAACGSPTPAPTYRFFEHIDPGALDGNLPNAALFGSTREYIDAANVPEMLRATAGIDLALPEDTDAQLRAGELINGGDWIVIYFDLPNHWWTITIWQDEPERRQVGVTARVGNFVRGDIEGEYAKGMWLSNHPRLLAWYWDSKQEHYIVRWQAHDLYFEFDSMCESGRDQSVCVSLADLQTIIAGLVIVLDE